MVVSTPLTDVEVPEGRLDGDSLFCCAVVVNCWISNADAASHFTGCEVVFVLALAGVIADVWHQAIQ